MDVLGNLTLGEIAGGLAGLFAILSVFVEFTPIKINPISILLEWIGTKTNKEVVDKVNELGESVSSLQNDIGTLQEKVNSLQDDVSSLQSDVVSLQSDVSSLASTVDENKAIDDERYAVACRVRILRFGDEVRIGQKHSKEGYDQVLSDIDVYDSYCRDHDEFKNGKTIVTTHKIKEAYASRLDANDFL